MAPAGPGSTGSDEASDATGFPPGEGVTSTRVFRFGGSGCGLTPDARSLAPQGMRGMRGSSVGRSLEDEAHDQTGPERNQDGANPIDHGMGVCCLGDEGHHADLLDVDRI